MLVVCTGNICRSPLAERLLQRRLGDRAVVRSAGVQGLEASAMDPYAAAQLERLGG
ncbi:MAG: low molecular weight phosphatase family protein, partial [Actinomycetota bacterium]|nr:low molecular weight phosphatase family protein [Actinomycetota bacterium]